VPCDEASCVMASFRSRLSIDSRSGGRSSHHATRSPRREALSSGPDQARGVPRRVRAGPSWSHGDRTRRARPPPSRRFVRVRLVGLVPSWQGVSAKDGSRGLRYARRGERMPTVPARTFHGRDAELALIRNDLGRLSEGVEAVVVVEGSAGMGKSRLLAEVAAIARTLGIRVGAHAADPGERVVELAALLAALFDGSEPLLDPSGLSSLRGPPEQRYWLLRDLQQLLERAALESPLLIAIDDAHWADGGTVAALRTLPMRLMGLPIAWLIARRPAREPSRFADVVEQLAQEGARRITLGPLNDDAVTRLAADMLGADPDQSILEHLTEAEGSPFLVVETLLGLDEEGRVRIVNGHAELIDGELPRRVREKMRQRLGRLSDEASDAATVAASLGRTFTFDQLARTLGRPASDILAPVGELLEANLLVERDERFAFWHDITREAVRGSVPVTARRALDRQAAGVLLEAGALPVEVAAQLADSAEVGDEVAIATLLDAAKALVTTDPNTAARFGRRALEIAPPHHPQRGEIVSTTAIALHIAGNSEEAIAFADRALRETLPAAQEAEVRLSIAGMFAISPEIRIGAGRLALNLPDLPETLRARHLACLFHNLVTAGRLDGARDILDETRRRVDAAQDARSSFTLRVAESALEYTDDRFGPSRELITAAYRGGIFAGDDQRLRLAHMWHGELLSVTDRDDEALQIAADGLAAAHRDRQGWAYQMFETWHGRMLFRTGRLSEALAVLEGRYALEDGTRAAAVLDAAGIVALGRLAIHTGDSRQARRLRGIASVMLDGGTPAVRRHARWLLALLAMADGDGGAARGWLAIPEETEGRPVLPRFPCDIADDVMLARIATASEDDQLARRALASSQRRAALNPGVASIAATAAHVRGLVDANPVDLGEAVDLFERTPRRLELAAALEDLGVGRAAGDREAALEPLGRSLTLYTEIGATWDARRVRSRLRQLGVRRRVVMAEPATHGWTALTASEITVARLVSDGLTNREVADRLFVSPHTVNSHLRHVFTKLGINSRVELARVARDYEMA
jgi:DNA-binding CsgD family transcriptional regulator